MTATAVASWQRESAAALGVLDLERMPALELLYLDSLAAHLLGPDAPEAPYTIEHGTTVVEHLLRSVAKAHLLDTTDLPVVTVTFAMAAGREAVVEGAHTFAALAGPGVHRLVTRLIGAVVGELELHREDPERQVLSLFHFGLLAIASGPENRISAEAADGIIASFAGWNEHIGAGYVPPWRQVEAVAD